MEYTVFDFQETQEEVGYQNFVYILLIDSKVAF